MPRALLQKLSELASSFIDEVLRAVRAGSIEDLVGVAPDRGRRAAGRAPRSPATTDAAGPTPPPGRVPRRGGRGGKK